MSIQAVAASCGVPFDRAAELPTEIASWDRDEVHLWLVSLDQPAARIAALRSILSQQELKRASRFRFDHISRRYVVAHGLLRELLAAYLGERPEHLEFEHTAHGKPVIATRGRDPLHFNLSHSGELALLGLAQGQEVGVDLEMRRFDPEPLTIANHFFTPIERAVLQSLSGAQRCDAFYSAWTCKEAYVKAIGRGLSEPLDRCEVIDHRGEPARFVRLDRTADDAVSWSIFHLRPRPDAIGALCIRGARWRVRARWVRRPPDNRH
jgi:4'-phosphopantetheinyl transferase